MKETQPKIMEKADGGLRTLNGSTGVLIAIKNGLESSSKGV